MSPAQTAYCVALAAYEHAHAEASRRAPAPPEGASEAEIVAWTEAIEVAEDALGLGDLVVAKRRAEDAMLTWSFAQARAVAPTLEALATIAYLETKTNHLRARAKLIDAALRLAV
jgi:hypothetical protein